jgi:hypothetical protein
MTIIPCGFPRSQALFTRKQLAPLLLLSSLVGPPTAILPRPGAADPLPFHAFHLTTSPGAQLGALAAGAPGGAFLATWFDPLDRALRARLFARDGAAATADVTLARGVSPARSAAAYNARTREFLVVWQDGGPPTHVYGHRVGSDGTPIGSPLLIANPESAQGAPSVAVNGVSGKSFVVWDDDVNLRETDWDIIGLLLEPDATALGGDLLITYAQKKQLAPRVACDPARGRYLVLWEDEREIFGASTNRIIFAQALDTEGEPAGEPAMLTRTAAPYAGTAAALDPATGDFLVAWSDLGDGGASSPDLRLRRLRPGAGVLGEVVTLAAPGEAIQPALAYHPASKRYLLAWTDRREFPDAASLALARVLGPDGTPIGDEFDLGIGAHGAAIAAFPDDGPLLAGWTDAGGSGGLAAFIAPTAPPAPMPHVRDERPYTSDPTRLAATWSTVGFADGIREYRTAVGTTPGGDDVAPRATLGEPESATTSGARTGLKLEEGRTYYFAVEAIGVDGRASRIGVSSGALVDLTPPRVTITQAPSSPVSGAAVFAFAGSDNLAPAALLRYRHRLDGGAWSLPLPGLTVRLETLPPGEHHFEVQSLDPADNASAIAGATFAVAP